MFLKAVIIFILAVLFIYLLGEFALLITGKRKLNRAFIEQTCLNMFGILLVLIVTILGIFVLYLFVMAAWDLSGSIIGKILPAGSVGYYVLTVLLFPIAYFVIRFITILFRSFPSLFLIIVVTYIISQSLLDALVCKILPAGSGGYYALMTLFSLLTFCVVGYIVDRTIGRL